MTVVVDASIAVKWFLPELHAEAAQRLLRGKRRLLAPDLIWAEVGNVLWKKCLRREISTEAAKEILRDFQQFPIETIGVKELLDAAWELAEHFHVTVYDSLYLALAMSQNCSLVTADKSFYDALKGSLAGSLEWVEHIR